MKYWHCFLGIVLLLVGCSKDPKVIEEENRSSLLFYTNQLDNAVRELDELLLKVDSLNRLNRPFEGKYDPNATVIIRKMEITVLHDLMTEKEPITDPDIIIKKFWASSFINITEGNYFFFDVVKNGNNTQYIPTSDVATIRVMIERYKTYNDPIVKPTQDSSVLY